MHLNPFYIYRHVRLDTNEVFYIGKGHNRSRRGCYYERAHATKQRNRWWRRVVRKCGGAYAVEIMLELPSEVAAVAKEREFIALYGRRDLGKGTLVNLTDGGEGTFGRRMSARALASSRSRCGERHPNWGKALSAETRRRKSEAVKGEKHHLYGKKLPETWRRNMATSKYGAGNPMFGKTGALHPNSKRVVNSETGVVYSCVREAADAEGVSRSMLYQYLDGTKRNKTPLRRMVDDGV